MSLTVLRDESPVSSACRGGAVGIGLFDGVHRGHQELIHRVRDAAGQQGVACGVVTFDRHPATVVRPESAPRVLTTLRQRLELLETLGVDFVRVLTFDEDRSLQSPARFVDSVLRDELAVRTVVVGEGFHFGLRRAGDVGSLRSLAGPMGYELLVVPPVESDAGMQAVSSSHIRALLAAGEVRRANQLLGRPYEVCGVVEYGDQRGRTLGFPTANVAVGGDVMLPADGVYAARYLAPDGVERPAAVSIGRRPTFYTTNGLLLVEAFLLDFDGDLYNQPACVRVTDFIRGQERFDSADLLIGQMTRDVAAIRRVMA